MNKDERRTHREHIQRARAFGHANGLRMWPGGYVRTREGWLICQGWIQLWDMHHVWIEQWESETDEEIAA